MVSFHSIENMNSPSQRESFFNYLSRNTNECGVLLSTCNRLEYYWGEGYISEEIVSHIFMVTAGLKSSFIGDTAIQGQVKTAYLGACKNKQLNKSLHKLFQTALFVGKRVRSETGLSTGAVSYAQAVLEVLCNRNLLLDNKNITLIGVNNINEKIIRCLSKKGVVNMLIGNRTYAKAEHIAQKNHCAAFSFKNIKNVLLETDILISTTSAPHTIITKKNFPSGKEMLILDLAIPRDVDEKIGEFHRVTLINLTEIENQVNQNLTVRYSEIEKVQAIINAEVKRYMTLQSKML